MARFSSRSFRKTLRKTLRKRLSRRVRRGKKTRKTQRKQRGGGNTFNRNIPSAAVLANPISVDEYHGDNASFAETT
jgi:hypothetical protein